MTIPLRARWFAVAGIVVLAITAVAEGAQAPFRVADINTSRSDGIFLWRAWIRPEGIALGDQMYFTANDGIHGSELWRTDGTAAGTALVVDICPGSCSGEPGSFAIVNGRLLFHADDGVHGMELWSSDGTAGGTALAIDIVPGLDGSSPEELVAMGGQVLFSVHLSATGRELWRSDGTAAGTSLLLDINPGPASSVPSFLGGNGARLFFTAWDPAHGRELWASDGSAAGTEVLDVIAPGPDSGNASLLRGQRGNFAISGQLLIFVVPSSSGWDLWRSDGSVLGTIQLLTTAEDSHEPFGVVAQGSGSAFFSLGTSELWSTDGTVDGTVLVEDLGDDYDTLINPWEMVMEGSRLFFLVTPGSGGFQIWVSDGTSSGTSPAIDLGNKPAAGLAPLESGLLYFYDDGVHGVEPWKSDGTTAGSSLLADVAAGAGSSWDWISEFFAGLHETVSLSGAVLLRLFDSEGDLELWRLDVNGTASQMSEINGQIQAFEIGPLGLSHVERPLAALADIVVFNATDGETRGFELWRSDGSAAGTSLVTELNPGPDSGFPTDLTSLGTAVLFGGTAPGSVGVPLWRTDATAAGTNQLGAEGPHELVTVGGLAFFTADTPVTTYGLWESDGTPSGTFLVPGAPPVTGGWTTRSPLGNRLAFVGHPGWVFSELWTTDGTAAGTSAVTGSPEVAYPFQIATAGGRVFFAGTDGAGRELWTSDGTTAQRVIDLRTGPESSFKPWTFIDFEHRPPEKIAPLGSHAVFLADDGTTGEEPWISDGTEQGTFLLADVMPGIVSSDPDQLVSTGPRAFFVADDGVHGRELWSTDGTVDGTRLVLDIVAGPGSSVPRHFTAIDGLLLFTAWDPLHGAEAWVSDGTPEGTYRISDVAAAAASSSPVHFTAAGDLLYFVANDNVTGFELWAIGRSALHSTATEFFTVPPCRVFDSRASSPLGVATRRIQVTGLCGIPTTARAVAANVTVVAGTSAGRIQMAGALAPQTGQVLVRFSAGRVRAQQTMLRLGFGALDASAAFDSAPGTVDVIVDVTGYFE